MHVMTYGRLSVLGLLLALQALLVQAAEPAPLRLPLKFIHATPITTIEIGGQAIDVIVDTGGASSLTLSPDILANARATLLTEIYRTTDAFGQQREHRRFRIPAVTIGGRLFQDIEAIETSGASGAPLANMLGRELLRQ